MARSRNVRHVGDNTVPAFVSTQPAQQVLDRGFPSGDEGIVALNVRYKGTFTVTTAGGSPVTDGGKKILRSLTVETDKHGKIVDGLDGLSLDRVSRFENGAAPASTDCASNASGTTFGAQFRIAFADDRRHYRPFDTLLDMKNSRMTVKRQYGLVTDVQSAGTTPSVSAIREDISAEVLPGPLNPGIDKDKGTEDERFSEIPSYVPVKEKLLIGGYGGNIPTQNAYKIALPVGDRIYRRIYISQLTYDTNGLPTEVATVITENAGVSLKIGRDVIIDRTTWGELADRAKMIAQVETMPTGWNFIDFDYTGRIKDMLDVYQYQAGIAANLEIDTTNISNAGIVVILDSLKLIPPAAVGVR